MSLPERAASRLRGRRGRRDREVDVAVVVTVSSTGLRHLEACLDSLAGPAEAPAEGAPSVEVLLAPYGVSPDAVAQAAGPRVRVLPPAPTVV
ncbi:MAG: hypothetical protein Q8Q02_00800, partial [Nocardioides sp.]|nr:hypothetical protein [Nocardioides sp.]